MNNKGQRQSGNVEDKRVTPRDVSMGMNNTLATQAAPKGNRPRYDAALNTLRAAKTKAIFADPHLQDMLDRMNGKK
jgi:hypothetical protein